MQQILNSLSKFCVMVGVQVTEGRLKLNAQMLAVKYTPAQVSKALNEMVYTHKWFPDIPEIVAKIEGSQKVKDDMAEIGAGDILEVAANYSPMDADKARLQLGEFLWGAVEHFGGFETFTSLRYEQLGTARAQLRNLLKAKNNTAKIDKRLFFDAIEESQTSNKIEQKDQHSQIEFFKGVISE